MPGKRFKAEEIVNKLRQAHPVDASGTRVRRAERAGGGAGRRACPRL
jgi:hypothetical protein